jgi:hypothetical protein
MATVLDNQPTVFVGRAATSRLVMSCPRNLSHAGLVAAAAVPAPRPGGSHRLPLTPGLRPIPAVRSDLG